MREGSTIWITGLSASGKSCLARALAGALETIVPGGIVLFDGDEFRARLDRAYGHDLPDRFAVLRLLVDAVRAEVEGGRVVVVAGIAHRRAMRVHARERLGRVLEVFLDCPAEVCAARDPKGLYARALAGEFACFPGVTEPYERTEPDLVLDTAALSVESALQRLLPAAVAFVNAAR